MIVSGGYKGGGAAKEGQPPGMYPVYALLFTSVKGSYGRGNASVMGHMLFISKLEKKRKEKLGT